MINKRKSTDDEFTVENDTNEIPELELEEIEERNTQKIKKLQELLKHCNAERVEVLEDLQRVKADYLNSKRRLEERFKLDTERAKDKMMYELLLIIDSFDIAMNDKEAWGRCDENWKKGIKAIYAQLMAMLKSYDVDEIKTVGSHFDPKFHEAVSNQEVANIKKRNTVVAVLQKGYTRNDNIIRPAKVVVGL